VKTHNSRTVHLLVMQEFVNPQLMFLPQCERQVSHPYKTTGKIIVLFILIFILWTAN